MNEYKKYIKSPRVREKILNALFFLPDSVMLKLQYRIKLKRRLNLKNPKRYTEKLQWYKMYYRNSLMHKCVDKYLVRDYVKKRGLENFLVDLYGKYNSIHEIDFKSLPECFVMKTTHGGGGLNVVICRDKKELDYDILLEKLSSGDKPFKKRSGGREWAYYGLKPGIIVEELLVNKNNPEAGINDYKFFCFDGKPEYIVADVDRYIGHKRNFYDVHWNNLHISSDCPVADREIDKPQKLQEMLKVASRLSKGFPYVRVDLYEIEGQIYFGEMTFYPWSGYVQFMPDKFDFILGEKFKLPKSRKGKRIH